MTLSPYGAYPDVSVILGKSQVPLDERILLKYLPNAAAHISPYGSVDLTQHISTSELVQRRVTPPRVMIQTYRKVLRILSTHPTTSSEFDVCVSEILERALDLDMSQNYPHRRTRFPKTWLRFVCLAEISFRMRSQRLGQVLARFFMRHGPKIARLDHLRGLMSWGEGIMMAEIGEKEKFACAKVVLEGRPELRSEIIASGYGGTLHGARNPRRAMFLQYLEYVAQKLPYEGLDFLGRGRERIRGLGVLGGMDEGLSPYPLGLGTIDCPGSLGVGAYNGANTLMPRARRTERRVDRLTENVVELAERVAILESEQREIQLELEAEDTDNDADGWDSVPWDMEEY
ncbi:hypothetical protein M501DRAFT_986670 [Patellaria atrata CBS 101060]|uniref:Uncharacterized protein n=1 Tax=Patellaria atrata CBS 101060 TaxID=1346257 RepID=A0A9P4S7D9_9PEZI|nr:hypothetical protein M501DRAFT_986670 [Patellaria atrata CBS 101060]